MQSKSRSMKEALASTVIGFGINYIANIVVLNAFALPVGPGKALHISVIFTVISVVRGYLVRRYFNKGDADDHTR